MIFEKKTTYILLAILLLAACNTAAVDEPNAVVTAFDKVLSLEEISERIPDHLNEADSTSRAMSIIQSWVTEQALLDQANKALPEELKNFDAQIETYKKSLLIFAYEEEFVQSKLDTAVSQEEIAAYYEANQENFLLKSYIVQARFASLPDTIGEKNKVRQLFFSEDVEEVGALEEILVEKRGSYFLGDDQWMKMEELLEQVPLGIFNFESYLKKNEKVEFTKDKQLYFLQIKDYRLKDDVSPLALEKGKIASLIIHKRRKQLISDMRESLPKKALERKEIIYHQ